MSSILQNKNLNSKKDLNLYNYSVALAGNPNVGKSTIFNALTGMHQHTGNWPGKTVENASGICKYKNDNFLFVDLPGTYSLMSHSEEEEIARDFICFGKSNALLIVVDATCLERNLNLVYQALEITPNVVLCVNLLDEAKRKGININLELLSKRLGIPVVGTIAKSKKTLKRLMQEVENVCSKKTINKPIKLNYGVAIEESISILEPIINGLLEQENKYLSRWISIKLIEGDKKIINSISQNLNINIESKNIVNALEKIYERLNKSNISKENFNDKVISEIFFNAEMLAKSVCSHAKENYNNFNMKADKILTSKRFGIPIMILFLGLIFWLTIVGANYPSELLSNFFAYMQEKILIFFNYINLPNWLTDLLVNGIYSTLTCVIAVMLPPMAIFFPLFTILEDLGYLPRIAFNLDKFFKKACASGKQALTMCMGFGCNAAGVVGTKIIDSPREKLIAILTNCFVPCNGRFPFLITIATIFFGGISGGFSSSIVATIVVLLVIVLGVFMTLLVSKILSKTILKGVPSSFTLELPPYRKPKILEVIVRSIFDKTIFVLGRAISIAAPAGLVIWLFANIQINEISILTYVANFFDPFGKLLGLDGYIITAFLLGLPANEIVLPIILMSYAKTGTLLHLENLADISQILLNNGWTLLTAINIMILSLLHFPCGTTLMTIKKETGSLKYTALSFIIPTFCGVILCMVTTLIYNICYLII
mgnify:CR=1 FL=1